MAKKQTLTEMYEALPRLAKIVLQVLFGGIIGGIYRILRFAEKGNAVTLVAGLLATFTGIGNAVAWIVDLYTEVVNDRITVLAD
ncbi:MAG: hypothetical protein IJF73_00730 [Clostridia bacterium]|nr:hypothetical protein [Clostridia bacterium]MBR7094619.1 hypothetical protein [Clostridia bacterium]